VIELKVKVVPVVPDAWKGCGEILALPAERWCVEFVLWWMLFCYIREFVLSPDTCDLTVQKQ
jgi:hypothetical protein